MSAPVVVEVYASGNKKTKTGLPQRWRWRALDPDGGPALAKGRHSFRTEEKALRDIELNAVLPADAVLRRPGQPDLPIPLKAVS